MAALWLAIGALIGLVSSIVIMIVIFRTDEPVGFLIEGKAKSGNHYVQLKIDPCNFDRLKKQKYAKLTIIHKVE